MTIVSFIRGSGWVLGGVFGGALSLGGCVLASPDYDEPTESGAASAGASTSGHIGESDSGILTATTSATDSGASGTATDSGASGSTTEMSTSEGSTSEGSTSEGSTTEEATVGTTSASSSGTTTEGPTSTGTTTGGDGLCDLSPGAWSVGEAVAVSELSSNYTEADPVLLSDGLTLLFSSNRLGGLGKFDSYYAVRSGFGEPFGPTFNAADAYGWNLSYDEGKAELTADGLEVVLASDFSGDYRLWRGLRGSVDEPFLAFQLEAAIPMYPGRILDPHLSADGYRVYFAQLMGGQYDILVTERPQLGVDFGPPMLVAGVNTGMSEANPSLSDDERLMIFARRIGDQIDLFSAYRPTADGIFEAPQPLAALNTEYDDAEPYLAEVDGECELFFVSNRPKGGDWDLYRAPILPN